MTENEFRKIEYLSGYIDAKIEHERINYVIESYKELKKSAKSARNEMISEKNKTDLSDYITKIEEKEKDLIEVFRDLEKTLTEIEEKIQKIEDKDERLILTERFINRKSMRDIAGKYYYSRRNLYRIYKRALNNLDI